jgi:putative methyltransferase (TIGR04325 family)
MVNRQIFKQFVPPILLTSLRIAKRFFAKEKPQYKKLISNDYSTLQIYSSDVWNSENWINNVKKSLLRQFDSPPNIHMNAVLSSIRWIHAFDNRTQINIIDFGGGCGVMIPHLSRLEDELNSSFRKVVIDSTENIKLGQSVLRDVDGLEFFDNTKTKLDDVLLQHDKDESITILNISSALQYIIPYSNFLESLLAKTKPKVICITRFPRCDDATNDAYGVEDITSSIGYCGSTVVNLFGRNTLIELMMKFGYYVVYEDFAFEGDTDYFGSCDDINYRKMTLVAYTFIRSH